MSFLSDQMWNLRPEVLLCANTVKPMHGVVPRVILGKAWWDKTRKEAYKSTNYHCIACGVHKTAAKEHQWLEGHEIYSTDYVAGKMTYIETVPLCHYCHSYIHDGRLKSLLDRREITKVKYDAVLRHGRDVLSRAGLKRKQQYLGPTAKWSDWRLVLFGIEYPPIYKTYKEWLKVFGSGQVQKEE